MSEKKQETTTETTTHYFDATGKEVKDKSKALTFWIREIDPNTKKLIHEQYGILWENFPTKEETDLENGENS